MIIWMKKYPTETQMILFVFLVKSADASITSIATFRDLYEHKMQHNMIIPRIEINTPMNKNSLGFSL